MRTPKVPKEGHNGFPEEIVLEKKGEQPDLDQESEGPRQEKEEIAGREAVIFVFGPMDFLM